jgi:hypothetical protein
MIVTNQRFERGHERGIANTEEAQRLQRAIFDALRAYADYLDRHGLIWDMPPDDGEEPELPTLKADCLVATIDFRSTEEEIGPIYDITLKGGAIDRISR